MTTFVLRQMIVGMLLHFWFPNHKDQTCDIMTLRCDLKILTGGKRAPGKYDAFTYEQLDFWATQPLAKIF